MGWNLQLFGGRGGGSGGSRGGGTSTMAVDANGIPTTMTADSIRVFFDTATPAQADAFLTKIRSVPFGDHEQHSDVQRFMNAIGWTEREPTVLNESQYQAAYAAAGKPQQYYHADNPFMGVSAQEFAAQFMGQSYDFTGKKRRQFMSGGVHGDGTYFADSALSSKGYGTNQFRGFMNGNAKMIDRNTLDSQMKNYMSSHPGFAHFVSQATTGYSKRSGGNTDGLLSVFAVMTGNNVIKAYDYYSVLDRSVMTVSTKQRSTRNLRKDW